METDDRRAGVCGGGELNLAFRESIPETFHQRLRPRFDLVQPDPLQILEGGSQLVDITERQRRVLELPRSLRSWRVRRPGRRRPPANIRRMNLVEQFAAHVERRHAEAR